MKKRICLLLLALALVLSGCRSWTHGSYESVKPHVTREAPQR